MPSQLLDELRAAENDPRLRPAEELVAGEADEIRAAGERLLRRRLGLYRRERARAEVVDEWQPLAPRDLRDFFEPRALLEADHAEVRLVDAQKERRLRPDRLLVVGRARAVRRPDLDQPGARPRKHIGNAEAVTDLD